MLNSSDILVLLKVAVAEKAPVRQVADQLGIPRATVQKSLSRLKEAGLIAGRGSSRRVNRLKARDFLINASRWIAPASPREFGLGIPTAHAAEPLKSKLLVDGDPVVIPLKNPGGNAARGRKVVPLHNNVPYAVER